MVNVRGAVQEVRAEMRGLLDYTEHLMPGLWIAVPPKNKVWHHVEADMPPALLGASGKATLSAVPFGQVGWDSRWQWAKRTAFVTALRMAGIRRRVTVPSVGAGQGHATVAVKVNGSRARLVALSPGECALRVGIAESYDETYLDVRRRIERYLPAPSFSISEDGAVMVEQWCEGSLLSQLPAVRRVPYALHVLDGYTGLLASEVVTDHGSVWRNLPAFLEQITLPTWLAQSLADPRMRQLLNTPLLAPGHGDCGPHNIILDEKDGLPKLVDFDTAGWEPVWLGPAKLVYRTSGGEEAPRRVLAALTGALDNVWAAAGVKDVGRLDMSHLLALVACGQAWRDAAEQSTSTDRFPSPSEFSKAVENQAEHQLRMTRREAEEAKSIIGVMPKTPG